MEDDLLLAEQIRKIGISTLLRIESPLHYIVADVVPNTTWELEDDLSAVLEKRKD